MTTLSVLIAARELLADPAHWTKGAYRLNRHGYKCKDEDAVCWCLTGALLHAEGHKDGYFGARRLLIDVFDGRDIPDVNDAPETKHSDILRWLDMAIEKAKEPA